MSKSAKKTPKATITTEELRQHLKIKQYEATSKFRELHSEAYRQLQEKGASLENIRQHSTRILSAGTMAGALLLASPDTSKLLPSPYTIASNESNKAIGNLPGMSPRAKLLDGLKELVPEKPRPLTTQEEKYLEKLIERTIGVRAVATLEGEHLNTTYGYIGAEQHLIRYPGDSLANHTVPEEGLGYDNGNIQKEGIAPGLGAWGYMAPTKDRLTDDLVDTERWYAVVQTLYLPDWNIRQPYLKNWYKYRKVLILNTENGKAVVASIADSGPAAWTGKHFGGSPEVMDYLGGPKYKKGPVILFFVDDPENKVPLGPVNYNQIESQAGLIQI